MTTMQKTAAFSWLISAAFTCVQLIMPCNAAEPSHAPARRPTIVSLEFDEASQTLWKATSTSLAHSTDEGRTWVAVALPRTAKGEIAAISISAGSNKLIYLAVIGSGMLRSDDGGRTWTSRNKGLPDGDVITLDAHSSLASTVFAYIPRKGIFISRNAGVSWHFVDPGPHETVSQLVHSNMPSGTGNGWLFAATRAGPHRTMDSSYGWHNPSQLATDLRVVATDAAWRERVYVAGREGLFISPDGGDSWIRMRSPVALITALASTPHGTLFGAINGNLIRSRDRGVTWDYVHQ
jgi:photosystem II stability/assembly factor-like uncharacterized protein